MGHTESAAWAERFLPSDPISRHARPGSAVFLCSLARSQFPSQPLCAIPRRAGPFCCLQESLNCGELLLCLLGLTFPWPGREHCLPDCVFHCLSGSPSFPPAQLHFSVGYSQTCPGQSSSSAVIFRMFGSGSAQRTHDLVDFAPWMGVLCSRAHFALSIILRFFSSIDSSPALYTLVWTSPNTFPRENRFPAADE